MGHGTWRIGHMGAHKHGTVVRGRYCKLPQPMAHVRLPRRTPEGCFVVECFISLPMPCKFEPEMQGNHTLRVVLSMISFCRVTA